MKKIFRTIVRRLLLLFQKIRIVYFFYLSSNIEIEGSPVRKQPVLISGNGKLKFNGKVQVGYFPSPLFFNTYAHFDLRGERSVIEISDGVTINNNAALIADGAKIYIGRRTLIGRNVSIYTSDVHGLGPDQRLSEDYPKQDVIINENVFIGDNVTVLKGVTIGDNSVIGNGAVVVSDIPGGVIAAGVPCKIIRHL
jgi:maltose O-acetyltransferase